jgi:exonuclease III
MIISTYTPNIGVLNFIKQKLLDRKGQRGTNTLIMCDFNIPLSSIDHPEKKNEQMNFRVKCTIDQMALTDSYRILHSIATGYTFLSAAYGSVSKTDHI